MNELFWDFDGLDIFVKLGVRGFDIELFSNVRKLILNLNLNLVIIFWVFLFGIYYYIINERMKKILEYWLLLLIKWIVLNLMFRML